jgi:hypothetical protein
LATDTGIADFTQNDPKIKLIIDRWQELSDYAKAAIIDIVEDEVCVHGR